MTTESIKVISLLLFFAFNLIIIGCETQEQRDRKREEKRTQKFISQLILEVGQFTSLKKVVFFTNLDFLYRKSYSKFDGFRC